MKIVHISLASYYVEGMNYQENCLAQCNVADGHETTVITTTFYWKGSEIVQGEPCDRIVDNGVRLIRLPFTNSDSHFTHHKVRRVKGLYALLESLAPDVILSHSLGYWSVLDVVQYKKDHPEMKFYADSHADSINSGTNWLSLHILHRFFYRSLTKKVVPYLEKFFYLSEECREFNIENYGIPDKLMEFYPLGGTVFSEQEYMEKRLHRRMELQVKDNELLLIHSGKLEAPKRTDALLRAFASVPELKAKLVIIGSIPEDRKELLTSLMKKDSRVQYLGWKSASELQEYLCACDLYCQPGSPSATMQNAICCGCAVLLYPYKSYKKAYDYGNIFWVETEEDIQKVFRGISIDTVASMKKNSWRTAYELLDYRKLAARLYQ